VPELELEQVLKKHLGRVKAPEGLRLWQPSNRFIKSDQRWFGLPMFAGVAAAAAAVVLIVLWLRPSPSELRSSDPVRIANWLKSRSFNVPIRQTPPSSIRVTSAHVKGAVAEVDYLVAGRNVVLTVSGATSQPPPTPYHVVRSHLVQGQLFTLSCAFPQDARTACLLCHAGPEVN
jgi:hypothetical protein